MNTRSFAVSSGLLGRGLTGRFGALYKLVLNIAEPPRNMSQGSANCQFASFSSTVLGLRRSSSAIEVRKVL
jgi:hypothetical protein